MAEAAKCMNHPLKDAKTRCKRCNKPLCVDCMMQTEIGVFCSEECYHATGEFMRRVPSTLPKRKTSIFQKLQIKKLIVLIIVLVILYFVLMKVTGESSIGGAISKVLGWLGL